MTRILSSLGESESQFKPERRQVPKQRRFRRTPIRRAGKKVLEWESIRRALKLRFLAVGIVTCELQYPGCWIDNGLGFCHAKKRRNCSPSDLWRAILGCNSCHQPLELLPESEMEKVAESVIAARLVQP